MDKTYYTARAELIDNKGEITSITIFSMYETIDDAISGLKHFHEHGYNIISMSIERAKGGELNGLG